MLRKFDRKMNLSWETSFCVSSCKSDFREPPSSYQKIGFSNVSVQLLGWVLLDYALISMMSSYWSKIVEDYAVHKCKKIKRFIYAVRPTSAHLYE